MSRLLAIESATEACSVALLVDGDVRERFEFAPRRHAELVLPMAEALLAEAGLGKRALDAIAVGRGPGAFTGVRLAVSIAQGLAYGLGRPVVPVSTLAALALVARDGYERAAIAPAQPADAVLAAIDARMDELYAAVFALDSDGLVAPLGEEQLSRASSLAVPAGRRWIAAGSGLSAHGDTLRARLQGERGALLAELPDLLPRASAVARLAARDYAAGRTVDPALAQPVYLRDKVAQTLVEQGKA